jgi:uncharacterized protein YndB with AHSA1/START domain
VDQTFSVFARISKPVSEVFEAVADPDTLSHYFTTGGAKGRLETGATVTWDFHDFPGAFPVEVVRVDPDKHIHLRWDANDREAKGDAAYRIDVTMDFEDLGDGRTLVTISEAGWRDTPSGVKGSYGNCMGWSQMLCALKMWVEHGINLREEMYK